MPQEMVANVALVYWLSQLATSFFVYSFAGWVFEVVIGLFQHHRFINRGFNFGPVCPIYGVGALMAIVALKPLGDPLVQFVVGFFAAGILEYGTSWVMEMLFHARWWDYSDIPLNLNGRICLPGITLFSLLMLGVNYVSEPALGQLYALVSPQTLMLVAVVLTVVFVVDFTGSVIRMQGFMEKVRGMQARIKGLSTRAYDGLVASLQVALDKMPSFEDLAGAIDAARDKVPSPSDVISAARERIPDAAQIKAALAEKVPDVRGIADDVVENLRQLADPKVREEIQGQLKEYVTGTWSRYELKSLNDPKFKFTQDTEAFQWARQAISVLRGKQGAEALRKLADEETEKEDPKDAD